MSERVIRKSSQELIQWRDEILAGLGISGEELEKKVNARMATADERSAWETLRGIAFLLGDDK